MYNPGPIVRFLTAVSFLLMIVVCLLLALVPNEDTSIPVMMEVEGDIIVNNVHTAFTEEYERRIERIGSVVSMGNVCTSENSWRFTDGSCILSAMTLSAPSTYVVEVRWKWLVRNPRGSLIDSGEITLEPQYVGEDGLVTFADIGNMCPSDQHGDGTSCSIREFEIEFRKASTTE